MYDAITKHGLITHEDILGNHGTNLKRDKRYDQIFYHEENAHRIEKAGSIDFYADDYRALYPELKYLI